MVVLVVATLTPVAPPKGVKFGGLGKVEHGAVHHCTFKYVFGPPCSAEPLE